MEKRKKKNCAKNLKWAIAHLCCKKNFVLQLSEKCIVRLSCKEGKARGQFVLQYNILYCDFGAAGYLRLYCNRRVLERLDCIAA